MPERGRDGQAEPGVPAVGLLDLRVLEDRLDEQEGEDGRPDERTDPDEDEVLHRLGQLVAVVDRAGHSGQRVVEGDHQRQRAQRVVEEVLRQAVEHSVPDGRDHADGDRSDVRRQKARVHPPEHLREGALAGHRQRRARGRQDRGLRGGKRRGDDRQHHELVERRAEHVGGERAEDARVVLELGHPVEPGVGHHGNRHDHVGHQQDHGAAMAARPGELSESEVSSLRLTALSQPQ